MGAWIHIAWITNYFDLGTRSARLVLIGLMLASLIMSASLFDAFEGRGLAFTSALAASLVGGQVWVLARRHGGRCRARSVGNAVVIKLPCCDGNR